jgi:hypothetical protein
MTDEIVKKDDAAMMESVLLGGDLSKLTPAQRVTYYQRVCESVGLNPLTKPFGYITLNNKLVLYALKDAAEQLRATRHVSITNLDKQFQEDLYIVTASALTPDGRTDASTGVVDLKGLSGEKRANALMKAETKAKRRVTLSICGMGFLDESEISSIPDASPVIVTETGEIGQPSPEPAPMPYEQAAAMTAKDKKGEEKRLDTLSSSALQYIVENSNKADLVDAALTVLEHDHNMPRPAAA